MKSRFECYGIITDNQIIKEKDYDPDNTMYYNVFQMFH